ncbi:MAG: DUF3540 domain-containing protein [Planctomycetes bacterium]|nr:DUF3540 domain-containing protein [Planctomycetota bacterium]
MTDTMTETMQGTKLGPALVRKVEGAEVTVLREGIESSAQNALAFPYAPQAGDVVLVIGDAPAYIIGVLHAQGDMSLHFPANVHFHARGGFQFSSGERVEMQAPEVKVTAGKYELVARTLSEKVTNAMRWVKDLASLKAGRRKVQVDGANIERAERHILKAKKDVRLNGERIHLG